MSDPQRNTQRCGCGAEVLWVVNAEFPGMGLVLEPKPAETGGVYRVGRYSVTGQMFGKRSTDRDVPKHNPHRFTCPTAAPGVVPAPRPTGDAS